MANTIYATSNPEMSEREIKNAARARRIAADCMVLLDNKGALPAKIGKIALYGNGARHTVKGGTGSGDVNSRNVINVEDGLIDAGYEIVSKKWLDVCDAAYKKCEDEYFEKLSKMKKNTPMDMLLLLENQLDTPKIPEIKKEHISKETDTAIYVLSRNSGEGRDRRDIPGDYELTEEEKSALLTLSENYEKLVVVLNVANVIDLKFIRSVNPGAILLMSQLGNISGLALADIISGKVSPSGHLTTTWAENYSDYASSKEFNKYPYDEYYKEGIYVGYRYFDTFHKEPAFHFGHGWTYTKFDYFSKDAVVKDGRCEVTVAVKNIGDKYAARQVIQLYYSAPKGRIKKPHQELCAFAKTKLLQPGESEELKLSFDIADMASYDVESASYVLEFGEYIIRYGDSSVNTRIAVTLGLDFEVVTRKVKNILPVDEKFEEINANAITPIVYPWETIERGKSPYIILNPDEIKTEEIKYKSSNVPLRSNTAIEKVTMDDIRMKKATLDDLICQLTVEEMATLCVGIGREDEGGQTVVGAASPSCAGAAGETTSTLKERGIESIIMADGPAGLRLVTEFAADKDGNIIPESMSEVFPGQERLCGKQKYKMPEDGNKYYQYTTAVPVATALAQSWNMDVLEAVGDIIGGEMQEFGIDLHLAPGMNIHRNPLCGRNFEYYSEDPYLSGMCAAADTKGVQKHKGCGTTIKHFAFNNKEDNRFENNSHIHERAIREIYLRGFEIAIRESSPKAVMSSYNLINGEHTANSYELLTSALRDEMGFEGIVMTDWGTTGGSAVVKEEKYKLSDSAGCIKAGNNLIMPGMGKNVRGIIEGLDVNNENFKYRLNLADLQAAVKRILQMQL